MLGREEPDLSPVITRIMNAVFLEDEVSWDNDAKQNICSVTIYNYTARARAYTILAKWPEGEGVSMVENPREEGNQRFVGLEAGYSQSRRIC